MGVGGVGKEKAISLACASSESHKLQRVFRPRGGTLIYRLYRYVRRQRVCFFLAVLVLDRVWFVHPSLELGMFFRRSYVFIIWR